jgi:hypothetical protein
MREDGSLDEALESAMDELTTAFSEPIDVEQTLTRITAAAVHLVDGADYAEVMLIDKGECRSVAPADPLVADLDRRDAGRPFATLVKLSQDTNTPVRVVAQRQVASMVE